MSTKFFIQQRQVLPLMTQLLLKHRRSRDPEQVAKYLMAGLSMDEFIISGSNSVEIMNSLSGQFGLCYTLVMAPIALMLKMYEDMRVHNQMIQYRPFKHIQQKTNEKR